MLLLIKISSSQALGIRKQNNSCKIVTRYINIKFIVSIKNIG